jgi:hypothetical protein
VYFNIGGGSKLPGSSIDPTVNRLARYNIFWNVHDSSTFCQNTKVVPFQEKSSFHFVVLWKLLNGMD